MMASENNRKDQAAGNVERQSSSADSDRKTKHAKGPKAVTRAARRKATNSFQPADHGLLLRRIAYDAKGQVIPGIGHLYNSLTQRFDANDVLTLLAAEMAVVDYARMATGLKSETRFELLSDCHPSLLSAITRHVNSSRRNLDNSLKLLRELEAERAEEQVFHEPPVAQEGECVMSADESPCPPPLTKDDLFSEADWSSAPGATPSAEESGPPTNVAASPTEDAPSADDIAWTEDDEPLSKGQTNTPTEHPPADAAVAQRGDAASAETTVSQSTSGGSPQPELPKAA
jgi:hypothetical protein